MFKQLNFLNKTPTLYHRQHVMTLRLISKSASSKYYNYPILRSNDRREFVTNWVIPHVPSMILLLNSRALLFCLSKHTTNDRSVVESISDYMRIFSTSRLKLNTYNYFYFKKLVHRGIFLFLITLSIAKFILATN